MRLFAVAIIALLMFALRVAAALEPESSGFPKSPKAKTAIKKFERALDAAQADYDRAKGEARKELAAQLDAAIKDAMKTGSLDEANRIDAAKGLANDDSVVTRTPKQLLDTKWMWHDGQKPVISFSSKGWHFPHWGDKYGPVRVAGSRVEVVDPINGVKGEIVFDSQLRAFVFVGDDGNVVLGTRVAGK